jgi:hypothetical protein
MRSIFPTIVASLALFACMPDSPCAAQGGAIGIGGRFSMIRGDAEADTSAERFTGGQVRARVSKKMAVELSLDTKTVTSDDLLTRSRDYPIQASLLLYPLSTKLSPYVLGGAGWYSHRVDQMAATEVVSSETTREFGYHAGFGAELRLGRHAGAHADYRYTFLHFGSDDASPAGASPSLLPSTSSFVPTYKGSMWTAGLTVYF